MNFNTNKYRFATGKEPKGFGRWWFSCKEIEVVFAGKYSEAKKQAAKYFAELFGKNQTIEVLS